MEAAVSHSDLHSPAHVHYTWLGLSRAGQLGRLLAGAPLLLSHRNHLSCVRKALSPQLCSASCHAPTLSSFGGIPPPNALPKARKVQISSCWHGPASLALAASISGDNTELTVWESFRGVNFPHCWQTVSQMCTQFRATTSY